MLKFWQWLGLGVMLPILAWSKSINEHFDPVSVIIFWVTLVYCVAILGQFLAKKLKQPAVLGEVLLGILFGNLCYYFKVPEIILLREGAGIFHILPDLLTNHSLTQTIALHVKNIHDYHTIQKVLVSPQGADLLNTAYVLDVFSRFGIIYLLFMVGLDTSWHELKKVGRSALLVAGIGVIAPMGLGFIALYCWFHQASYQTNLFIAATLSATSVGITARVLQELRQMRTQEAKIILGAAMIDDVLGLLVLAVVSSLVLQGEIHVLTLVQITVSTLLFFGFVLTLVPRLIQRMVVYTNFLAVSEAKVVVAFVVIMLLSWVASLMGLSTIIGAFTAGLMMNDAYFKESTMKIKDLMASLQFLLAPLFFFLMGIQVKLNLFLNLQVLILALILCVIGIVGKLCGALGASATVNRWFIGVGMIPRGEVGLIFASMGKSIGVVDDAIFSAIVLMVVVTTVIAPPWMKRLKLRH